MRRLTRILPLPELTRREMVGKVVMPAAIFFCWMAAMKVSPAPTATYLAEVGSTPALPRMACVKTCVPEPRSVTPRFLPLRSFADVMLDSDASTTSASPGAMPNWQIVSIFLPWVLSTIGCTYAPDPASTLPATTSSSEAWPEPSSISVTSRCWSLK